MFKKCLKLRHYVKILQVIALVSFSVPTFSQVMRAPANYVPDDDMIVVPIVIEKNYLDSFHERHEDKLRSAKRQLRQWIQDEQFVTDYGLEDTGAVRLPTPEEKQRFFDRNYMRFLNKDVERQANGSLQETLEDITADNELDTIRTYEEREEFIVETRERNSGSKKKSGIQKEVKVGKEKFKFDIQPRVEMGMIIVRLESEYVDMRGWLGVNGNQEIKLSRYFKSTKTDAQVNFYIEEKRVLASVDQPLTDHMYLRLTHDRKEETPDTQFNELGYENTIIQVRFGKRF